MTWTLVAHTTIPGSPTGGTSAAIDTTGANLIVWSISHITAFNPTYTDSKSNSWHQPVAAVRDGSNAVQLEWRYNYPGAIVVGSGHTFTISGGGGNTFGSATITAWSGYVGGVFDNPSAGTGNSSSATIQPGSITPSVDGCLVLMGVEVNGGTDGWTGSINGGFTLSDQVGFVSANNFGSMQAYLIQTSAAAANPTFTLAGAATSMAAQSLWFPGVGGASHNFGCVIG